MDHLRIDRIIQALTRAIANYKIPGLILLLIVILLGIEYRPSSPISFVNSHKTITQCLERAYRHYECFMAVNLLREARLKKSIEDSVVLKQAKDKAQDIADVCLSKSSLKDSQNMRVMLIHKGLFLVSILPRKRGSRLGDICIVQHQGNGKLVLRSTQRV